MMNKIFTYLEIRRDMSSGFEQGLCVHVHPRVHMHGVHAHVLCVCMDACTCVLICVPLTVQVGAAQAAAPWFWWVGPRCPGKGQRDTHCWALLILEHDLEPGVHCSWDDGGEDDRHSDGAEGADVALCHLHRRR